MPIEYIQLYIQLQNLKYWQTIPTTFTTQNLPGYAVIPREEYEIHLCKPIPISETKPPELVKTTPPLILHRSGQLRIRNYNTIKAINVKLRGCDENPAAANYEIMKTRLCRIMTGNYLRYTITGDHASKIGGQQGV